MEVLHGARSSQVRALFSSSHSKFVSQSFDVTWTELPPVWSGGQCDGPAFALVFINPTYRNQSVMDDWPDEYRAPHIGHRRIWEFLASCQMLPETLPGTLPDNFTWDLDITEAVYSQVSSAGLYITNLVKATRTTSALPSVPYARQWTGLLARELAIVKPQIIITFGTLVTSLLAGYPFRMRDAYESAHPVALGSPVLDRLVFPAYFPCGRGEPARAREMIVRIADARIR